MTVIQRLLNEFPEMKKDYDDLCQYWRPEQPSIEAFFADVVSNYLIAISKDQNLEKIDHFFDFINSINSDKDLQGCLRIGVGEVIEDMPEVKKVSWPYIQERFDSPSWLAID